MEVFFPFENWSPLLANIDPSDYGWLAVKKFIYLLQTDDSFKVLGTSWYLDQDVFHFHIFLTAKSGNTKRKILSTSKIFLTRLNKPPIIFTAKILLQQLWSFRYDWDEAVLTHVFDKWFDFHSQLPKFKAFTIPRWNTVIISHQIAWIFRFFHKSIRDCHSSWRLSGSLSSHYYIQDRAD